MSNIVGAAVLPGLPHLLAADPAPGWVQLRDAARAVGEELRAAGAETLMLVSTQWISVLGLQVQTRPMLQGTRVDENWYAYDYGTLEFRLETDVPLAEAWLVSLRQDGFQARKTDHPHFPVDTGLLVAAQLLDPDGALKIAQVSLNLYGSSADVKRLGAAAAEAAHGTGRNVAMVAVSALSSHPIGRWIEPGEDRFSRQADSDFNGRVLGLLQAGDWDAIATLPDAAIAGAAADSQLRALHYLHGATGALGGLGRPANLRAYAPVWGMGAAVLDWRNDG